MKVSLRRGFTLIELLIVISIMGILAAVLLANMATSGKIARDTQRRSDLRNLQNAIEAYRHKYGHYPDMGCTDTNGNGFSDEDDDNCSTYIANLAPEFISRLPHDPSRGSNAGYAYVTNPDETIATVHYTAGLAYKIMAIRTVEADTITYTHPFKSCDIRPNAVGLFQNVTRLNVDKGGWCAYVYDTYGNQITAPQCRLNIPGHYDGGDGRFGSSYGLWGGYANNVTNDALGVVPTTDIICK